MPSAITVTIARIRVRVVTSMGMTRQNVTILSRSVANFQFRPMSG